MGKSSIRRFRSSMPLWIVSSDTVAGGGAALCAGAGARAEAAGVGDACGAGSILSTCDRGTLIRDAPWLMIRRSPLTSHASAASVAPFLRWITSARAGDPDDARQRARDRGTRTGGGRA